MWESRDANLIRCHRMDCVRPRPWQSFLVAVVVFLSRLAANCHGQSAVLADVPPVTRLATYSEIGPPPRPRALPAVTERATSDGHTNDACEPAQLAVAHHEVQPTPPLSNLPGERAAANAYPLDLANALALGGANSLQIRLARARVVEAYANFAAARALWVPSLRGGVVYNNHEGRIQQTRGPVIDVSRHSLFAGGGLGMGDVPLAGGAGGPMRMMFNLSLADAAFEPLVANQLLQAQSAAQDVAFNDALLAVAVAYFSLVEAHGMAANSAHAINMTGQMLEVVKAFERGGIGSFAEVNRATAEQEQWKQVLESNYQVAMSRSAELARQLRLPPQIQLMPADTHVLPIAVIDSSESIDVLIGQALSARPEIWQASALVEAACWRHSQEMWRPWLPFVQVGASGGAFGGGPGGQFPNADGRSDVDLAALWELRNLGFGTAAERRRRRSQLSQAQLQRQFIRDQVAAEVAAARSDADSLSRQIRISETAIVAAEESYRLNLRRIRDGRGVPIEVIQAIRALTEARNTYTRVVLDYNRAQYRLLRSIGTPPAAPAIATLEEVAPAPQQ